MTLIEPNTSAELIAGDPNTLALALRLVWQQDRFGHAIDVLQAGQRSPLLETVVDPAPTAWPRNTPLQQASLETIDGRLAILGVGLAGTSHWSLSLETLAGESVGLRIDCACRCTTAPESLGSQYRWADGIDCQTDAFAGILFRGDQVCVQVAPDDEKTVITCTADEKLCEIRPESLPNETPQTIRWCYQFLLM
ncbi:hypothetical protein Poly24_16570 [Rosistilla carotiformis]|uniref:Uncharacterized protein n=1 Tax=Rosistilla carotiformis TaxID=2528017 RepID=A0A518JQX6_9BACT|nr:hypothetical protein [Rosistilla carotiformis]QDV67951.1 hypothetical protein Poly24_16570 [Rosistilla carotiformis]